MGARRLVPTRRRGRAWGVPGLTEPGGRDGAGGDGDERELEGWGGGMVGRAGAGRLAVEEAKEEKLWAPMSVCIHHVFIFPSEPLGVEWGFTFHSGSPSRRCSLVVLLCG